MKYEVVVKVEQSQTQIIESLASSIDQKLDTLSGHPSQSYAACIYRVSPKLRKANEAAYTARLVSIGPLHWDLPQLHGMEALKLKFLSNFLSRFGISPHTLVKFATKQESFVRRCYEGTLLFSHTKHVEVILLDGVFVVELFLENYFFQLRDTKELVLQNQWMYNDLLHDMLLLENQLPISIMKSLLDFVDFSFLNEGAKLTIYDLAKEFFKSVGNTQMILWPECCIEARHFVEFLLLLHAPERVQSRDERENARKQAPSRTTKIEYTHSATEMQEAGVKFHERMKNRFGHLLIWLRVSQVFDPLCIFEKILQMLAGSFDSHESMEALLEMLHKALKDKTYRLVLDDVWNEDPKKWQDFMNCLSSATSTKGNGIIITTRSESVASIVKPVHTHVLEGLSKEDCWSIIKAKAFSQGDDPSQFEAMGGNIARRCCGLPLAADVVGGLLYSASMEKWNSTEQSWLAKDERQIILETLGSSFDNLSLPSLKKCFIYCSIFPKGHHISKQAIIEMWMAEGFLEAEDMESVGNSFFNALIHSSLLVAVKRDDVGNVESCVMYDLVHDMASYILASSDHINQHQYLVYRVDVSNPIPKDTANYLSMLIFIGEITDHTMFSSFTSLHALTLDCDQLTELPSSIVKLRHLRNLNISNTSIERLPDWIKELHHLQTLNALTESLKELPSTFKYLINLRHLYIPSHVKLPDIRRFSDLRALKYIVGDREGYKIEELGSLINLREVHIPNVGKVRDKHEAEKAKLFMKPKLSMLQLEWDDADREGFSTNDESVLEGLQPTPGLEKLKIKGFGGRRFPAWILRMEVLHASGGSWVGLDKLVEITLSMCTECEEIPILGHLPNLKSLHLWALWNVKSIKSSFYRSDRCRSGFIFPALESMLLSDMPELREWEEGEFHNANATRVRVFPRLQSLKIYHCKNLESLPIWLFSKAQNLTELDIRHCSKLKKLPAGVQFLSSLESMTIKGCRVLKSIEHQSGGRSFKSLRSLDVRDCQDLVAMEEYSRAPLLKKVSMAELKSLENLPWFIDCLAGSHFLEELTIAGVPKFMSTSSLEIWPFIKLRKLEVDVSREGSTETSEATMKTVDGFLKGCCLSLGELTLTGLEIWECSPESIENLSALYSLELENFGVEELPIWLGNLSSLTRLCLSNCAKLKHLPPKDAMQHLTKLQELHIRDCPELRIESERQKIFHVRNIYVDGHPI